MSSSLTGTNLNDEARLALGNLTGLVGWVHVGVPQDFAETWLPPLLARFQRTHPKVRIEARGDRSAAMADAVGPGALDLALTQGSMGKPDGQVVCERRLAWIAVAEHRIVDGEPLPLVALDAPCAFQRRATSSLDAAGRPWRHVFSTSSLLGVWAAVRARLGVTVRTVDAIPSDLRELHSDDALLPDLGSLALVLHRSSSRTPIADAFADLLLDAVAAGSGMEGS